MRPRWCRVKGSQLEDSGRPDDADAEHRHAEGLAAHRPRVPELEEVPDDKKDGGDGIRPVSVDGVADHDLHAIGNSRGAEDKGASAHGQIDDAGREPRDRARVLPW